MNGQTDEIDEIEALLPWYAAGALDAADVARVEAALAQRPALRQSLALVREDRDETIALDESLGAPSADVWSRVLAVAQAEPRKPSLVARAAGWLGLGDEPRAGRLAWAGAAAAAVVIVAQGVAITELLPRHAATIYGTASGPEKPSAGAEVEVAFAPDARLDQLGAFLRRNKAVIVDGPRGGYYRLRIGDKPLDKDEMDALITKLRAAPLVTDAMQGSGK